MKRRRWLLALAISLAMILAVVGGAALIGIANGVPPDRILDWLIRLGFPADAYTTIGFAVIWLVIFCVIALNLYENLGLAWQLASPPSALVERIRSGRMDDVYNVDTPSTPPAVRGRRRRRRRWKEDGFRMPRLIRHWGGPTIYRPRSQ